MSDSATAEQTDSATGSETAPLLECAGIGKTFGGVTALAGVDFTLQQGEVHGLVGSNGAGKSTLMKILAGVHPDHEGVIKLKGEAVSFSSPKAASDHGIAMVYQELSGIGALSVAENLVLGRHPVTGIKSVDWKRMRAEAREHLSELDIEIDVKQRLDRFPLVIRQMVEIARGLHSGAQILILDEPTSALSPPETQRLFTLIRQLKAKGVAMIFISHFIEDVLAICDHVTILKDGRLVETRNTTDVDKHYVIHKMLGHSLEGEEVGYETGTILPPRTETPPTFQVKNLTKEGLFRDVNVEASPGECVGLYGFVGAGHQELVHALAGAIPVDAGSVTFEGTVLPNGHVKRAVDAGIVMVAADRESTLIRPFPIYQNTTAAHLTEAVGQWILKKKEIEITEPLLQRVGCRPPEPRLPAGQLSGGNQQKVVMAKWLLGPIRVLLLEEPTRGMDVGAKEEIMNLVKELKAQGTAVILASTEPELLITYADRILTFSRGKFVQEFVDEPIDKPILMRAAGGAET